MAVLRKYLFREIALSTVFILAALLALFGLLDLIGELADVGKQNYRLPTALAFVALSLPGHVYELMPIAALIGTLFALGQLSASSEYAVMRVSGVSAAGMVGMLLRVGTGFAIVTFVFGEFIAPPADQLAQRLRIKATQNLVAQEFRSGLWVRDSGNFINVAQVTADAGLRNIKVFEFGDDFRLRAIRHAQSGEYQGANRWRLKEVTETNFEDHKVAVRRIAEQEWLSVLSPDILSVLLVVPEQMSVWNLYQFIRYLQENQQQTRRHEIALWTKLSYPFAVWVMMLLALPFTHLVARAGNLGAKIFTGIMLGLGFHLVNRLFAHMGLLSGWPPLTAAALPTLSFLAAALFLLWRIERR